MRIVEDLEDMRIMASKLSGENKKYVVAVAQALLFTQKREKSGQKKIRDRACYNQE